MKVFLASSKEAREKGYLRTVQAWVEGAGHQAFPWDDPGLFVNQYTLPRLIEIAAIMDAAVILFTEDDIVEKRGEVTFQPRDNVNLEYGLFVGKHGQARVIMCCVERPALPSDIFGINTVRLGANGDGNLRESAELNKWLSQLPHLDTPTLTVGRVCSEDEEVRRSNGGSTHSLDGDQSDLNYLLLSVAHPERTRAVIKEFVNTLHKRHDGHFLIKSEGLYDITGKWDVLFRFRLSGSTKTIVDLLRTQLKKEKLIQRDTEIAFYDIVKENSISGIHGTCFDDPKLYDLLRCQRGFMWIHRNQADEQAASVFEELKREAQKAPFDKVIQAVHEARDAWIFEIFMRCSQTNLMNRFNEIVESHITKLFSPPAKYTLLCFTYDEQNLENATGGII